MDTNVQLESNLRRIVIWGSAVSGAVLAATLQAYRLPSSFEFSGYTAIAFLIGGAVFWGYWKMFFMERQFRGFKALRFVLTVLLVAAGLAGVLYPLRFVGREQLPQLFTGLVMAAFALSGVGMLLLGCKRLFDEDEKQNVK
jgi:CDP-diglyceride synthetase